MRNRLPYLVLIISIVVLCIPILINRFFVTLDGPSHLYNASLMLDLFRHPHSDFLPKFYYINDIPDTNWFSHIALATLMVFMKPFAAEKFLQLLYVVLFVLSSFLLINYLNKKFKYAFLLLLPFVYNHTFQMGFYNYSLGLTFMMLSFWFYLSCNVKAKYIFYPVSILLFLLTYLAHPIAFLLLTGVLLLYSFFEVVINTVHDKNPGVSLVRFIKKMLKVLVVALPGLILTVKFFYDRRDISSMPSQYSFSDLAEKLLRSSCIVTLTAGEDLFGRIIFFSVTALIVLAIITKIMKREIKASDSFLVTGIALLIFYFKEPDSIAGGGIVPERILLLPYLFLVVWLCTIGWSIGISRFASYLFAAITVALLVIRMPVLAKSSDLIGEILSCESHVKSKSLVLPLDFAHSGIDREGNMIANRIWIYMHMGDYLGTIKPLIMLGNFEANISYFPVNWQNGVEPFYVLGKCDAGIEGQPPCINLMNYKKEKKHDINYVVLMDLVTDEMLNHPYTKDVLQQLNDNHYKLIYTSPYKRVRLYQLMR